MEGLQWYPRYAGDYIRKTRHLSLLEHGAYNLLLDHYYATGKPIKVSNAQLMPDHSRVYRLCSAVTQAEKDAVDSVLEMFFDLTDDGYINDKASEVIEKQRAAHDRRVEAGRKGGQAKVKQKPSNAKSKPKQPEPEPDIYNNSIGGLEKLSVDDIAQWLNGKRASGKYLMIDEYRLLEMFKDYCMSKGKRYKDYVAAYRNAFEWHNAPRKGDHNGKAGQYSNKRNKSDRAKEAIARGLASTE
jgi:uncharacterized protein YdaU (DUF1376 family)